MWLVTVELDQPMPEHGGWSVPTDVSQALVTVTSDGTDKRGRTRLTLSLADRAATDAVSSALRLAGYCAQSIGATTLTIISIREDTVSDAA